jgi:hypothetical protein
MRAACNVRDACLVVGSYAYLGRSSRPGWWWWWFGDGGLRGARRACVLRRCAVALACWLYLFLFLISALGVCGEVGGFRCGLRSKLLFHRGVASLIVIVAVRGNAANL